MSNRLVVFCTPFGRAWQWPFKGAGRRDLQWKYFSDKPERSWQRYFQQPNLNTPIAAIMAVTYAKRHRARLLITFDPRLSFWCALVCRILNVKIDHIAFSFNFSQLPTGWKKWFFTYAFRQLRALRVHSNLEKTLYSDYFGIHKSLIEVRLWSMGIPEVSAHPPVLDEPYVSAVGGNARDYATLLGAAQILPAVPMVWVVRPENIAGLKLPQHVRTLDNVPYSQAMNVVAHSRMTVVPLKGSQVPCGHVTLVSGMLLKKAVVATNSAGITDYVTDGWNGLLCKPNSAEDLAEKILTLWEAPESARRLGENGFRFATEHCSETMASADMSSLLQRYGLEEALHTETERQHAS